MDMTQEHLHPQAPNPAQQKILAVAELLSDPKRWAKTSQGGATAEGFTTLPYSMNAVAWCISGAIRRNEESDIAAALLLHRAHPVRRALDYAYASVAPHALDDSVFVWNDRPETTHAQVMQLLAAAITYAGETTTEPAPELE